MTGVGEPCFDFDQVFESEFLCYTLELSFDQYLGGTGDWRPVSLKIRIYRQSESETNSN